MLFELWLNNYVCSSRNRLRNSQFMHRIFAVLNTSHRFDKRLLDYMSKTMKVVRLRHLHQYRRQQRRLAKSAKASLGKLHNQLRGKNSMFFRICSMPRGSTQNLMIWPRGTNYLMSSNLDLRPFKCVADMCMWCWCVSVMLYVLLICVCNAVCVCDTDMCIRCCMWGWGVSMLICAFAMLYVMLIFIIVCCSPKHCIPFVVDVFVCSIFISWLSCRCCWVQKYMNAQSKSQCQFEV